MKREGGRSATEAMERKLEGKDPFAPESEIAKETQTGDLVGGTYEAKKNTGTDKNGFFHVLKIGFKTLKMPFLGRISRGEYILGNCILYLIQGLLLIASMVIGIVLIMNGDTGSDFLVTNIEKYRHIIFFPALIIWFFSISLSVKRFHDFNNNGRNILLFLIPVYNIFLAIKLAFFTGDSERNIYGDDPLKKQPESNLWYWMIPVLTFVFILTFAAIPVVIPRMSAPKLSPDGTMDGYVRVERADGSSFLVPEESYDEELFNEHFGQNH